MAKIRFFFIIFVCFLLVVFVMNKSIASYLEQKYHINISYDNEILDEANAFKVKLERIKAVLSDDEFASNYLEQISDENESQEDLKTLEEIKQDENLSKSENNTSLAEVANLAPYFTQNEDIKVSLNDEFLLIGDSLMQGVSVALSKYLKTLGLKSTNLSKQNTGLSYKSYYDWAKASEAAFKSNANLKVLVVLLGANDPWDIKFLGKYRPFNSPTWREIYSARVDEILDIAQKYGAQVIWYQVPIVKKSSLDDKLQILNEIYETQSLKYHALFIKTRDALSLNGAYSTYIKDENNKSIKVRADDGVHFSYKGAEILSQLLIKKIKITDSNQTQPFRDDLSFNDLNFHSSKPLNLNSHQSKANAIFTSSPDFIKVFISASKD